MIHVSRSGKVIGKHTAGEVLNLLSTGVLRPSDYWWVAGMKDWVKFSDKKPSADGIAHQPSATPVAKPTPKWGKAEWKQPPPHEAHPNGDLPATEKQVELIASFGISPPAGLTKHDASRWIDNLIGNDLAESARMDAVIKRESLRSPSGKYREEMNDYIESAEGNKQAMEEDMKEAQNMMGIRIDFWEAVLKTANPGDTRGEEEALEVFLSETGDDLTDERMIQRLLSLAKRHGSVPGRSEIERAIKAADAASEKWDDEEPELFFRKLIGPNN